MSEDTLIVYQADDGAIELKADIEKETVWATRMQMAEMFGVNPQAVSKHIKNIYQEEELEQEPTSSKMELVQDESGRQVKRNVKIYDLDVLISVGYRINSKVGTKFRKWATKTLKQHITQGYTINPSRITKNYDTFLHAVEEVKALAQDNQQLQTDDVLVLVKAFAHTWFSLESYDEDNLPTQGSNRSSIQLEASELYKAVAVLKKDLMDKGQATALFAQEKNKGSLQGIVGNIYESAFGEDVYPTLEEKAANLLYFIIK